MRTYILVIPSVFEEGDEIQQWPGFAEAGMTTTVSMGTDRMVCWFANRKAT